MYLKMIGPVAVSLALWSGLARAQAIQPSVPKWNAGVVVQGVVTKTSVSDAKCLAEFGIKETDGVASGDRLLVVRPSQNHAVVNEIEVELVDDRQSTGVCLFGHDLKLGDVVLFQRKLSPKVDAFEDGPPGAYSAFVEPTYQSPPGDAARKTFNAKVTNLVWTGRTDIAVIEANVYASGHMQPHVTIPATALEELRLNGQSFVLDAQTGTLVTNALRDYRVAVRVAAEQQFRKELDTAQTAAKERAELAKARIAAEARYHEEVAMAQVESQQRVEAARAQIAAEERAQIAAMAPRPGVYAGHAPPPAPSNASPLQFAKTIGGAAVAGKGVLSLFKVMSEVAGAGIAEGAGEMLAAGATGAAMEGALEVGFLDSLLTIIQGLAAAL